MTDKDELKKIKDKKTLDETLDEYSEKAREGLFNGNSDFDEAGLISGSIDAINKSDAELFPDELEEYTNEERKPRIVVNNDEKAK